MLGSTTRFLVIAVLIALAAVMGIKKIAPEIPISDEIYLLAGLIGIVIGTFIEWLVKFIGKEPKK